MKHNWKKYFLERRVEKPTHFSGASSIPLTVFTAPKLLDWPSPALAWNYMMACQRVSQFLWSFCPSLNNPSVKCEAMSSCKSRQLVYLGQKICSGGLIWGQILFFKEKTLQGDNGGLDMGWLTLIWNVPPYCPVTQPILPHPRQNQADGGMTKTQLISLTTIVTLYLRAKLQTWNFPNVTTDLPIRRNPLI